MIYELRPVKFCLIYMHLVKLTCDLNHINSKSIGTGGGSETTFLILS